MLYIRAVSSVIIPCLYKLKRLLSIEIMFSSPDENMAESIWCILLSRIIVFIALFTYITSKAGTTPPSAEGTSCCDTTALSTIESCTLICCCWCSGNASTIRSMVFAAPIVCSVERRKCPVSAAVTAVLIVSLSLISPSCITSGDCLKAATSAVT